MELLQVTLRLLLALLCGGLLGVERGKKRRPAGLRTHILVCVGAALAMVTNEYICERYPMADASRMGSQVISGIGFLGAGTILVTGLQKIGIALGAGFYSGGIVTTVLCMLANTLLKVFESRINANDRTIYIFVELADITCIGKFLKHAKSCGIQISELELGKAKTDKDHIGALMLLKAAHRTEHARMLEVLGEIEGVYYIEEIN